MAARAGVRQSFINPENYVDDNTVATTNIAKFTKSNNIEKLILASISFSALKLDACQRTHLQIPVS